ncbi:hypothetical protein [Zeaxanthinibacter enoshimensis]|uniref:hypothetical protein n=1 Tax=Zeaxanthinibacter enoshimensis TaxID=392009 RepID=UPI003566ECE7
MEQVKISGYHRVPQSIEQEARKALSYYPALSETHITFKFKENIRKSTMQAQPDFKTILGSRKKRKYYVLISNRFKISGQEFRTRDIPSEIMIGWLGHELGHILDYTHRSGLNLLWFGFRYLFFSNSIKAAERTADAFAVANGMEHYILKTKEFILNHAAISPQYKNRIKKFYLSPEEIMEMVAARNNES